MAEDLKLFGEVGLGYSQLQKDAETINKLLSEIDKNAKILGKSFKDNNLNFDSKQSEKEMEKLLEKLSKMITESEQANKATQGLAENITKLSKAVNQSAQDIQKSTALMSKIDLGAKEFARQSDEIEKSINKQRDALAKWAKEKSNLTRELSLRDMSQMVVDDYKFTKKNGNDTQKAEALKRVQQAMEVVNYQTDQNRGKVEELTKTYKKLAQAVQNLSGEEKKLAQRSLTAKSKEISAINRETKMLDTQAKRLDKILNFDNINDKPVKNTTKSLGMLLGQAYAIKRAFGYINKEVMEFERRAIEVQRIAGYTKKEMNDLAQATFDMGKNMGLNVNTIQEIEGLWARAGRGGQALVEATKTTAMGFNVAEFKDAESAVASLNSIINQMYNGDATKAPEILDALTKVADKTAVRNVNDLVEVVSRAGANAKSLGMDLHELNAASAVVMERMKLTGDVLGTQFKTLFAYMGDSKRINNLKKYGVEFTTIGKDGTESMKPFMEMMDKLVGKYRELKSQGKDVMANDMLRQLSGVRNVATLRNLVDGWDSMREKILISKNSKGFAEKQNEKIMESYAKKVEQLKVTFQELAVAIGDSGLLIAMKNITDGLRYGLSFVAKYNKEIGTLITTVLTFKMTMHGLESIKTTFDNNHLGGLFKLMTGSQSGFTKAGALVSYFGGGREKLDGLFSDQQKSKENAEGAVVSATRLGTSLTGLKASVVGFSKAMGVSLPVLGAFAVGLGAIATTVGVLAYKKQQRLKILEDFTSGKADKAIDNVRQLKQELDDIIGTDAYKNGDKTALDAYKNTSDELAQLLGISNNVTIGNKESMDLYNESLKTAVVLKEREYELNKQIASTEAKDKITKMMSSTLNSIGEKENSGFAEKLREYESSLKKVNELKEKMDNGDTSEKTAKRYNDAIEQRLKSESKLIQSMRELKELQEQSGMSDNDIKDLLSGQTIGGVEAYEVYKKLYNGILEASEGLEQFGEKSEDTSKTAEDLAKNIRELTDSFKELTGQASAIEDAFKEVYETGHLSGNSVMKLLDADSSMVEYIAKTKDGYVLLDGALEHYNETQAKVNETVEDTINKFRQKAEMETDLDGNPLEATTNPTGIEQNIEAITQSITSGMEQVKASFNDGKDSADEFFKKLKSNKNSTQLKGMISGLDTSQIKALNNSLASDLKNRIADINKEFTSGSKDVTSYAGAITQATDDALDLYVQLNDLHKNTEGMWVNQKGEVDEFANSLSNATPDIEKARDSFSDLMKAFENTPEMATIFEDVDFDIPAEKLGDFAKDFTDVMNDIRQNNQTLWNMIVEDISKSTGMSKSEAEKCLTNVDSFIKRHDVLVKSAVGTGFINLAKALSLSEGQIATTSRSIGAKLTALADLAINKMSLTKLAMNNASIAYYNPYTRSTPRTYSSDSYDYTSRMGNSASARFIKAPRDRSLVSGTQNARNNISNQIEETNGFAKELERRKREGDALFEKISNSTNSLNNSFRKSDEKLAQFADDTKKSGGSKGSRPADVPQAVNDKLEDLRHELEMGRISEEQFYKGVDKLYRNNSGSMTKRGKQRFEKMLKDAKNKADSSIPPYVKVLIDNLDEQLKYGEIDQYTYSSKLDAIARKYKAKLGQKAVKEIEMKISQAKVGGIDKYFKAQIDEFENIIKVSDLAVRKIQAEQSLLEALNMGDTAGMSLQETKINVINNKLYATEALAKKYESVLKAINEEIKNLDTNSNSYHATLQGLVSKQEEFTNKLGETRVAVIELQKQRIEEQMKVYDAMQKQYDDAVSNIEQIESKLVAFINSRNQKIREQLDKNHKARMDSIDEEAKARDKELEKEKKRLQDALEAYRKYTQGKIDSLDKANEEEDYNKELEKKMKERDELQYRINSLSLDDTSTARGKRIELTKQLADKNSEIEDFQRERSRKLTKDGLDQQLKEYEETLKEKENKLDENAKHEQELRDNRKKALEDEYRHELEVLDEKMKASSVYAEAKNAILSGYVQNAVGASITIRNAMVQSMEEQGHASGILRRKYINDLDAIIRKAKEAQQIIGMAGSSAGAGSLQQRLGLTDKGYQDYLGAKANYLGFSKEDTERYIMNKLAWQGASEAERKRIADENHQLRAKYAGDKNNWNNKNFNKDINGSVLGVDWIMDTGSAMKVGQPGGQFTPLGGNFGRDEARDSAVADLGLYNPYTLGSSEAFFDNQRNWFNQGGFPYTQPNLGNWTNVDYYKQYKDQSKMLNKFIKTPSDMSDHNGALGYIRNYKEELQNNINNDTNNNQFPTDSADANLREALMAAAKAQNGLPYSQGSERYTTHRDCSSYVYYAVKNSGLYGGNGFYTGDMIPKLAEYGWKDLGRIPKEQIKRGDIFWIRDGKHNHTEIATQDGTLNSTGAHSKDKLSGESTWIYDYRILRNPRINGFSSGGIADYTGVAMLHGSKSSPEYIFNAPQFDALGRIIANYVSAPSVYGRSVYNGSMSAIPEINIDTLINIEGNASEETVREIKTQADDILDKLVVGLKKRGIRR